MMKTLRWDLLAVSYNSDRFGDKGIAINQI